MRPRKAAQDVLASTPLFPLPAGMSVLGVADRARSTAFEFVANARYGWGRRELATWLVHDYRHAVLDAEDPRDIGPRPGSSTDFMPPSDGGIAGLAFRARRQVVERLRVAPTWSTATFARSALNGGLVVGVADESNDIGFAPIHRPRMRLADRVISLFVADYLTRPHDYDLLLVCPHCDELSFKWDEVHEDGCEARHRRSGFVTKARITERGLG